MKNGIIRLLLVLFPVSALLIALILNQKRFEFAPSIAQQPTPWFKSSCSFFTALLPLFPAKIPSQEDKEFLPVASKKDFFEHYQNHQASFQKNRIHPQALMMALPISLTKDTAWIVSNKSFILSSKAQRTEISHLNKKDLQDLFFKKYKKSPLFLQDVLKAFHSPPLFLKIKGKKDLKALELFNNYPNPLYLFSRNEKLLNEIPFKSPHLFLIYPFKKLIQFQVLSLFQLTSYISLPGQGILIPSSLSPSFKTLSLIKNANKILIGESSTYDLLPEALVKNMDGFVTSHREASLKFMKNKKSCLIKN